MVVLEQQEVDTTMNTNSPPGPDSGKPLRVRDEAPPTLAVADQGREWLFPGVDEYFRGIYTRAGLGFAPDVLAVCSAVGGEGKTTLSVGLGVTLAQDFPESRILIVETDLNNPVLAADFDVDPTPGLIDCVHTGASVQDAYRPTFLGNLHVVPVGGPLQGAGRVLRSIRMASAIDAMRQTHDVIILDVPPILVNSDSVLITDLANCIMCVIRSGVTPMDLVNKAITQLDAEKLRGVVLNGSDSSVPRWIRRMWAQ
jgi:capsular exopolysaccharide synthesis family protein